MAILLPLRAARMKTASRRPGTRLRNIPGNGQQPFIPCSDMRDGLQQGARVGMTRPGKHRPCWSLLYHLPGIHHEHPIADFAGAAAVEQIERGEQRVAQCLRSLMNSCGR